MIYALAGIQQAFGMAGADFLRAAHRFSCFMAPSQFVNLALISHSTDPSGFFAS